jgi:hypothetical protein
MDLPAGVQKMRRELTTCNESALAPYVLFSCCEEVHIFEKSKIVRNTAIK